jgi:hypothetical protein
VLKKFRDFLAAPVFNNDDDKTRIASHLFLLSKIGLVIIPLLLILYPIMTGVISIDNLVLFLLIPLSLMVMGITRKGYVRIAGSIYTLLAWLYVNYTTLNTGGIHAVGFGGNLVVLVAAAILIDLRAAFVFGALSSAMGLGLAYLQTTGMVERSDPNVSLYTSWITQTVMLIWITGLIYIAIDNIRRGLKRSLKAEKDVRQLNQELVLAYQTTLEGWAKALELRDKETEGHSRRVVELTRLLAIKLGYSQEQLVHVLHGSLLHDIGKMGIPDSILRKPSALTDEERKIVELHPVIAFNLLRDIEYLHEAIEIPYSHHEKWNGEGYPNGWQGEEIPLSARIFAIVDVWDALQSDRPYRPAWPMQEAVAYLHDQSGRHFDPHVVDVFLNEVVGEARI